MSRNVERAGWTARFGGLMAAVAMVAAVVLPAATGSATTVSAKSVSAGSVSAAATPGWTASTAPGSGLNPSAGTGSDIDAVLADVACPAVGSCAAVGNYEDAQGYVQPLTEVQSGGAWKAATAPLTGLDPAAAADPEAKLTALACPATGTCVAIGSYQDSTRGAHGLIETLSGGVWTAQTEPLPAGISSDSVQSISCPSATWCVAAGTYGSTSSGSSGDLIATLANGTWTASPIPDSNLPVATGSTPELQSISCSSVGACVAVGSFDGPQNYTYPLVATLDAGTWSSAQPSVSQVNPPVGTDAALTEVSCTSDGFCAASGSYSGTDNHQDALVATRSAGTWSLLAAPETGLSPARETGQTENVSGPIMDVNWVQCPAAGSCVAVGEYVDVNGGEDALAEVLSNGTWSARTLPVTGLSPGASSVRQMTRVSCVTSSWCVAIGAYYDNSGGTGFVHGMFETLSNGTWSATTAPVTGLNPGPDATGASEFAIPVSPNAIACETAGSCVSVGYYESVSGGIRGLIETLGSTAGGYWLTTSAGNVYNFNAPWYGSEAGQKLASPVVGIAADPVTGGYWLVTSAGTVYNFNAPAYGPSAGTKLSAPVVGITSDGDGFLLATSDGNVYNFNVPAYGSEAGQKLPTPIDGIGIDPATTGYWLITGVGNVHNFNAPWSGSEVGTKLPSPVVGITAEGDGYLLTTKAGNVYPFDAPWSGSEAGQKLPAPVVGIATAG